MSRRNPIVFVLFAALIGLLGCMSFNGAELTRRELPAHDWYQPTISTEVGKIALLHNGREGLKPPATPNFIGNNALSSVLLRWKAAKLIADYGKPGELEREADFRLAISGSQDEQSSIFAAVVTGITLFLFPSSATLDRAWTFELENLSTKNVYTVTARHTVTQWQHLIFLPVFPFSVVGQMHADRDLSHYVYDEFAKQGAWKHGSDDSEQGQ